MSLTPSRHAHWPVATHQRPRYEPYGPSEEGHPIGPDALLFGIMVAVVFVIGAAIIVETHRLYKEGLARHKALQR